MPESSPHLGVATTESHQRPGAEATGSSQRADAAATESSPHLDAAPTGSPTPSDGGQPKPSGPSGDWHPPDTPLRPQKPVRELTRPGFSPIASLLDLVIGWAATVGVACWASGALGLAQQPLAAMSQGIPPQGAAPLAAAPLAQQPLAAAPLELIGMATLCYLALRLRQMLIWAILAYQRFAPAAVRRSCVFEPSCSEYMLRSLERHGLIAGLIRGFARLTRCHEPNGGVDEP